MIKLRLRNAERVTTTPFGTLSNATRRGHRPRESNLHNREDALDAVQEAFLDAFQALGRLDLTRPFYPWFYIMLRNRCYKLANRRRKREASSSDEMQILTPTSSIPPEDTLLLERRCSNCRQTTES
jgi:RNA polymerase sigma factor (sigma-70 family)